MLFSSSIKYLISKIELIKPQRQLIRLLSNNNHDNFDDIGKFNEHEKFRSKRELKRDKQLFVRDLAKTINLSIAKSNEEKKALIKAQIEIFKERGVPVIDYEILSDEQFEVLINEPHRLAENLIYFTKKEQYKVKDRMKREEAIESKKQIKTEGEYKTNYPGHNSIFRHITTRASSNYGIHYALSAFRNNGPKLVFDFQYEHTIDLDKYLKSLLVQLLCSYGLNMDSRDPFCMYYVNLNPNGKFTKKFEKGMDLKSHLVVDTEKSYLDLFPKEKIVILSPDAPVEMQKVDEDNIYVIGVMADKGKTHDKHSLRQARKDGVRCERLPLERYTDWGTGSKELTLDQVTGILLDYRATNSWYKAFKHLPQRKMKENEFGAGTGLGFKRLNKDNRFDYNNDFKFSNKNKYNSFYK